MGGVGLRVDLALFNRGGLQGGQVLLKAGAEGNIQLGLAGGNLARKVGISAPPCLRRVRALEEAGIIEGFTAILDDKALGFDVSAILANGVVDTGFALSFVTTAIDEAIGPGWIRDIDWLHGNRPEGARALVLPGDAVPQELEGGKAVIQVHQDGNAGLPQRAPAATAPRTVVATSNSVVTPTILAARREMQSWRILALEPSAMRKTDRFHSAQSISASGEHLPATLYRLATQFRVRFDGGWGLLRASNTQPVLVLRYEARDSARLAHIRETFEAWLRRQGVEPGA